MGYIFKVFLINAFYWYRKANVRTFVENLKIMWAHEEEYRTHTAARKYRESRLLIFAKSSASLKPLPLEAKENTEPGPD